MKLPGLGEMAKVMKALTPETVKLITDTAAESSVMYDKALAYLEASDARVGVPEAEWGSGSPYEQLQRRQELVQAEMRALNELRDAIRPVAERQKAARTDPGMESLRKIVGGADE